MVKPSLQLPWLRAPRAALANPLTVLVTVVAALLLSFVAGAAVLHTASAGSAAISYQEDRSCTQNIAPSFRVNGTTATGSAGLLALARDQGAQHGFPNMVGAVYSELFPVDFHGLHPTARIGYRDGAYDNLKVLQGGDHSGTWVPLSYAQATHTKLGDRGMGGRLPPVTAIYQDLTDPPAQFWCTERDEAIVHLLAADGASGPVVFVPSQAALQAALDPAQKVTATVHYRLDPLPATITSTQDVVARGGSLITAMRAKYVPPKLQGRGGSRAQRVAPLNYDNNFSKPVQIAQQSAGKVRDSTLPLTVISLIVGLIGLASVAVQWCQRRQAELRLLWSRGSGSIALGGRAVLELAGPLIIGSGLGLLLALLLRGWYAPPGALPDGAFPLAALLVVAVALAGLVVVGLTVAVRSHRTLQAKRGGVGRSSLVVKYVPWELITAVLALLAWLRLKDRPTSPPLGRPIEADPAGLAFPLLVVLTVALVATRLVRIGLTLSHRTSMWRWPAGQLAMRRLAAAGGSAIGILVVGILAVGTLTVGAGVADAQQSALNTKSAMLIGANSAVKIPASAALGTELPPDLTAHSTLVGIMEEPGRTIVVVDPATFTRGAWLEDRDAGQVQSTLQALQQGNSKHALRVGRAPSGSVDVPFAGRVDTPAHLDTFPYISTKNGYVVPLSAIDDVRDLVVWQVWSSLPLDQVVADLDAAGVPKLYTQTKDKALDGLPFLTVTWTFDFVVALGLVLGVVAAVALVLAVEVRRRQNAVSGTLATRMGLRRRTLTASHVLELGSLAGFATTAGCVTGLVTTGVSVPLFDPAPWLKPIASIPDLVPLVSVIYLISAAVVAMVSWMAVRSVRTAHVGELIRG